MCFPSIRLHHPSAISKGNRFTADSVRQTHGGLLCFRPRDTTSLYFFFPFADLKDFVSPGQRKNSSGRGRGRKAARGKRKRRPLVLEGAGLSLVRQVNGSSCPAWPTLMKLQISRLHESSHSPFSSSSSCSAPTWTSFHKEGIPPLRPLSSALRQSDCWTRGGRWDILN